jgi:hypothetical protein
MALITCPDCKNECSDLAETCPKCGHPIRTYALNTKVSSVYSGDYAHKSNVDKVFDYDYELKWHGFMKGTLFVTPVVFFMAVLGFIIGVRNEAQAWILLLPLIGIICPFVFWITYGGGTRAPFTREGAGSGKERKCPSCQRWWARRILDALPIGDSDGVATITNSTKMKNTAGNTIGTYESQNQVQVKRSYCAMYCKCRFCGNRWQFVSVQMFQK